MLPRLHVPHPRLDEPDRRILATFALLVFLVIVGCLTIGVSLGLSAGLGTRLFVLARGF